MCHLAVQVSIEAPVPSIAALAMHKWLQDLHLKVQTEGPSCLHKHVVLSVGLWVCPPTPSTPPSTPATAGTAPPKLPEEKGTDLSQGSAQTSAQAGSQRADAAASLTEPNPRSGQKRTGPALPAVAAKIFGPKYTAAANQAAVLDMVRGLGLPFTVIDRSDGFRLEADGAAVAEWLQAEQFDAIMTGFAQPLTSPVAGMPTQVAAAQCPAVSMLHVCTPAAVLYLLCDYFLSRDHCAV